MTLSDDKTRASLDIRGDYAAADLEALISKLSALRSSMAPPVPALPPTIGGTDDVAAARSRGDPRVQVAVMRDGLTRFWVRHDGLGWFAFNLPTERANLLANYILDTTNPGGRDMSLAQVKRRMSDLMH